MKAVTIVDNIPTMSEVARPACGPSQVVTKVAVSSLNRADLIMLSGRPHGSAGGPGTILGLEWAGEVVEVGSEVKGIKVGDRVMCSGGQGHAEFAVSDWGRTTKIPGNNMSYDQAATLPVAIYTMHDAVVTNGRLAAGESVLIQGASSGVGLMALQIAKLKGARLVIGTSTNASRRDRLREYGADLALDTKDPGWADAVLKATDGKGVDLIVDQISASVANDNLKAAAIKGRIVNVGRLGGFKGEFDFDLHALKRIDYIGVTFRTRTLDEVRAIGDRVQRDIWGDVEAGKLSLPIDQVFDKSQAAAAYDRMRRNEHFGKILIRW